MSHFFGDPPTVIITLPLIRRPIGVAVMRHNRSLANESVSHYMTVCETFPTEPTP